jgi:superfamily I DNA/RNA helicase
MDTTLRLTDEQERIVAAAAQGDSLKVEALAGTGKTSTMRSVARVLPLSKKIVYLAFNRSTAQEARGSFPSHVTVKTSHALAMGAVGFRYRSRLTTNGWQVKQAVEQFLRPELARSAGPRPIDYDRYLYATLDVLRNFQYSSDPEITEALMPAEYELFCNPKRVADLAWHAWQESSLLTGCLPITHDLYVKVFQLAKTRIPADTIIVDEMQDSNPVLVGILKDQSHAQIIGVGDDNQAIYGFRGATNALKQLPYAQYPLTLSWRFGDRIAAVANTVLEAKGCALRVRGKRRSDEVVQYCDELPTAVITRTNAGLVAEALQLFERSVPGNGVMRPARLAIVGGADPVVSQIMGAYELYERGRSSHPNFRIFESWQELTLAVETSHASSLRPFVGLVEKYNYQIPEICERLKRETVPEPSADVVLSTAHKFKGGESARVRISGDFSPFVAADQRTGEIVFFEDEANLAYVALTRAKKQLQLGAYRPVLAESLRLASILNAGGTHDPTIISSQERAS